MFLNTIFKTLAVILIALFLFIPSSYAGTGGDVELPETDSYVFQMFSFFDLRDRETYVQVTNIGNNNGIVHVQIFDVSNNCNENNFFDKYTPADTHVYNMRDIQTNDGDPSGVVLPDGAYGFVSVINVDSVSLDFDDESEFIGNFRVVDNNGYEYRTNSAAPGPRASSIGETVTFNFNTKGGVTLSDVIGIVYDLDDGEIVAADLSDNYVAVDVDIFNENEVPFSCRNVVFACTDQDNPLLEDLLETVNNSCCGASSNVASFEYGINNTIPHSKGGELLCPGNIISDGIVTLDRFPAGEGLDRTLIGYVGLNNGNGRGSMDSFWHENNGIQQQGGG